MRWACLLLLSTLVAMGCQHAESVGGSGGFDYPHTVVRVDVARLFAGDMRYNIAIRDGDVLVPSNEELFEGRLDAAGNLKTDRVSAERPMPPRYEIKPGDLLLVTIYELREPGKDDQQHCRVDGRGWIRLKNVGPFDADGSSPGELEQAIAKRLEDAIILRDPTVSVQVLESKWFYRVQVPGVPRSRVYAVKNKPMRLIEALTREDLRGVEDYRYVYVVRRVSGHRAERTHGAD